MVTADDFRDKHLVSLLVGYGWHDGQPFAELAVAASGESPLTYRISGLSALSMFEDFDSQDISECTLLQDQPGVYLSLDPYLEGQRSDEDNQWFAGSSVELVSRPGS